MSNGARYDMMENGTGNGSDVIVRSGGKFTFTATGSSFGTVHLELKDPQGNYLAVASGSHSAAGTLPLDLCPGTYRVVATTTTAVYAYLIKN